MSAMSEKDATVPSIEPRRLSPVRSMNARMNRGVDTAMQRIVFMLFLTSFLSKAQAFLDMLSSRMDNVTIGSHTARDETDVQHEL